MNGSNKKIRMTIEKINFNDSELLHSQIHNIFEKKILNHDIAIGAKIPPEKDLCQMFGVTAPTVGKALTKLVKEGYLVRRPSLGTFVINSQPEINVDLKTKNIIGIVLCVVSEPDISDTAPFNSILQGIEQDAKQRKMNVMFKTIRENENEPLFFGNEKNMMGILVTGRMTFKHLKMIKKLNLPFVQIGDFNYETREIEDNTDIVTNDEFQAFYMLTKYFIDSGHRRIAFLRSGKENVWWYKERLRGYKQAHKDANIECFSKLEICPEDMSTENSYSATREFLEKSIPFTALLCPGTEQYQGSMNAIREKGLKVPDDISIACKSGRKIPGLTTVFCDVKEIGKSGVERLIYKLTNPLCKPGRVIVPAEIINKNISVKTMDEPHNA